MNKPIIKNISDKEFINIITNSETMDEAGKKFGFAHRPGKGSKEKIYTRMKELGISFKQREKQEIEKNTKESKYSCSTLKGLVGEKYFEFLCAKYQIPCFRANSDVDGYDYLISLNREFKKVQVKTKEFFDRTDRSCIF